MGRFFESSLAELASRHSGTDGLYKQLAPEFTTVFQIVDVIFLKGLIQPVQPFLSYDSLDVGLGYDGEGAPHDSTFYNSILTGELTCTIFDSPSCIFNQPFCCFLIAYGRQCYRFKVFERRGFFKCRFNCAQSTT